MLCSIDTSIKATYYDKNITHHLVFSSIDTFIKATYYGKNITHLPNENKLFV